MRRPFLAFAAFAAFAAFLAFLPLSVSAQAAVPFHPGMVITKSLRITPGRYLAGPDSFQITIRGSNLTVDLTGVTLIGNTDSLHPDRSQGTAIRIDGGSRVTVKGAHARGFKVGLVARGVTNLRLLDNDFSYNWKPRLYSGIEKESLVDWLDYHQNEKDEWLRYGAGIYLVDVTGGELKGNTVRQGMNGLLLTRVRNMRIWNNDFSFNSGLGVGMYRSSVDTLMHNRIEFDVRGYSHGFFNRGQDSAGLLMYEQCDSNIVAYNSVTHGGDGLFLWAGQSTMDTGQGGANDNLFFRNDFSFAPTNGMEATFSRNAFIDNTVEGNWHGLWGGYSWESVVRENRFIRNVEAIAIEHGQRNTILGNTFQQDTTAIHLWANKIEPSDWGYPKFRDTRSFASSIMYNQFVDTRVAVRVETTTELHLHANRYDQVDTVSRIQNDSAVLVKDEDAHGSPPLPSRVWAPPLRGGINALRTGPDRKNRAAIIVDDWGPYDWKSPKLWPVGRSDANPQRLRVLGPRGTWRLVSRDGVQSLSATSGLMGDTLVVLPSAGRESDYRVVLEYRGVSTITTSFGRRIPADRPFRFSYERFIPTATWQVKFVAWDSLTTPRTDAAAITRALSGAAVATLDTNQLDLTWYGPPRKTIPQAHVLTGATATLRLTPGNYLLRTIADDAIKVYLDDKLVLEDWTPGESRVKEVPFHATGEHRVRIEHLQVEGWYELRVDIVRQS